MTYLTKGGPTENEADSFPLYAGQDMLVGEVLVWDDGENLCVKYQLNDEAIAEGWLLTETHLAVATSLDDIPQTKKGNPIPGQFPYGDDDLGGVEFYYQKCILFSDIGSEVVCDSEIIIAAHAVVCKLIDDVWTEECETAWGGVEVGKEDFPGKNWATYFEYIIECPPCVVTYPETGNVYIGYEDWTNGDFDYNDFGMNFSLEELYEGPCEQALLKEVTMTFKAVIYDSGMDHKIHIATPFIGSYGYTVTRNVGDRVGANETASGTYTGSGPLDITLFNTAKYDWPQRQIGEIVTVHVVLDVPELRIVPAIPVRSYNVGSGDFYDLAPIMANYDPWEEGTMYSSLFHIEGTQVIGNTSEQKHIGSASPNLGTIIPVGTEVPMIIVSENTDWIPPFEDTTITGPYPMFDDFYTTGSPADWYDSPNPAAPTGAGGFAWQL